MRGLLDRAIVAGAPDEPAVLGEVGEVLSQLRQHERREYTLAEELMASGRKKAT